MTTSTHAPRLAAAALLCTSALASGAERCKLADYKTLRADHPRCLFHSGTHRYSTDDYVGAAAFWQRLIDSKRVAPEHEHLRVTAHSNIGYLYHRGLGVPEDGQRAVVHWTQAYKGGHDEATYHLCKALTDPDDPLYRPAVGIAYCKEALRRFNRLHPDAREVHADQIERIKERLR